MGASRLSRIAIVIAALCGVAMTHQLATPMSRADQGEEFLPRPEVAKLSALGFDAMLADYYWIRAVQIVGASKRPEDHSATLGRLVDVVTTLDPWVDHPYRFAAIWLVKDREAVREANRLLTRGIAYHPDDWRNHFYLGFNHFHYLGDSPSAADALETASHLEGAPSYLGRLAARLRAGSAGLDVAEGWLIELARNAEDGFERAEYEKAIDEIRTERLARLLDGAREAYRERHGRDIESVEDLVRGADPILPELPPELHGWEWTLDPESGRIVSSYYMARYELHRIGGDATL